MVRRGRYIPNTLRKTRWLLKYRQKTVAEKTGIDHSDLSRLENGKIIPSLGTAFKFHIVLKKPVEELFTGYLEEIKLELAALGHQFAEPSLYEEKK
jgi:transcriptional regulator with XRE-family HTH domain